MSELPGALCRVQSHELATRSSRLKHDLSAARYVVRSLRRAQRATRAHQPADRVATRCTNPNASEQAPADSAAQSQAARLSEAAEGEVDPALDVAAPQQDPAFPEYDGVIIAAIKRARTWQDVLTVTKRPGTRDAVDLCTALHRCQDILGRSVTQLPREEAQQLRKFVAFTIGEILELTTLQTELKRAHTMSNLLLALARLHYRPATDTVVAMCDVAYECLPAATPQAAANLALALALLDATDHETTALLPTLSARCVDLVRI